MSLDGSKPIPVAVMKAVSHIVNIEVKNSILPNNSIQLSSGGPQPSTLTPIPVARKESQMVSKRTLRTKQTTTVMKMIAGNSIEATTTQTAHMVKSMDMVEREEVLKKMKHAITVPADHFASMKSTLNMPFNLLRDVRRWLQTFNINLAPEGNTRKVMNDWVGNGLRAEEISAFVMKGKKMITAIKPWCYLFNLVGYVIKFLSDLDETRQLCDCPFIPDNEIHLKIGGDHDGGSFKMSFQIGNVYSPNKPQNTVIFRIMEAKDYKSNLLLCLERFKAHIEI